MKTVKFVRKVFIMSIDSNTQDDIIESFYRIISIKRTGILSKESISHPLFKAAFIETMICLRNLMYHCKEHATRISFKDDINCTSSVRDITGLIEYFRNALCHIESPNHYINSMKFTFNVVVGKAENAVVINGVNYGGSYEDDICVWVGDQKICLVRHVERAFEEAKSLLIPLLDDPRCILSD